jgi:acyl-coenzyme A thioesterase PaaI-like protein
MRWGFNLWPCYRGTGARVTYIAGDWREVRVRLPLSWRTRNYVGTIFGGSLYASVDPFFMIMLMKNLGPDVVVWDKAASVRFRRPGRGTLMATFRLDAAELAEIRDLLERLPKVDRTYIVELTDQEGIVHAAVEKVVHIARRPSPESVPDLGDIPGTS